MEKEKVMLNFPDEIEHFNDIKDKLFKKLDECKKSVEQADKDYRSFQQYMVDYRSEIDPNEMFQNELLLRQSDNMGAIAVGILNKTAKIIDSPYFARIDFRQQDKRETSKFYIGRFSFDYDNRLLILDWRTPIASMFYDYEIGYAEYTAPIGKTIGELTRKRQFKITKGELEYILESSQNIQDDILQCELSSTSDEKMKSIISTIQKEQNAIIRNERAHTIIIQGVAGSGKTSIALHRLAYLLYRHKERLTAKNLTILSPNKVFADFISSVLPELGEEPILGIGFYDLAKIQLDKIINFAHEPDVFEITDNKQIERIKFKSTKDFLQLLDDYLSKTDEEIFNPGEYVFGQFRVGADWIKSRFQKYDKQPVIQRLKTISEDIYSHFDNENIFHYSLPKKSAILSSLKSYLKFKTTLALYKNFYIKNHIADKFVYKNQILEWSDVFPFLYFYSAFEGLRQSTCIHHLVIDEMQDYTPIQFAVINKLFACQKTILGDFGQSVNPFYSHTLKDLLAMFEDAEFTILNKSYRSSYEIISFAKEIGGIADIQAIERHGDKPCEIVNGQAVVFFAKAKNLHRQLLFRKRKSMPR